MARVSSMSRISGNGAEAWMRRAETGQPEALYHLGLMYSTGRDGVPLDYVTAHKWLNLAAVRGYDPAKALRAELAGDMSREEIAQAQRLAREWLRTHH
ncbi:MAG TPA: hypothetical protein VE631_12400 [Alphaproteobacteria bacterium]|nr:hypothetical protein [Alphaproteobacteria bacterium]